MCMLSYRDKVEYVPKKIFVVARKVAIYICKSVKVFWN